jgi:hypothetical protein
LLYLVNELYQIFVNIVQLRFSKSIYETLFLIEFIEENLL